MRQVTFRSGGVHHRFDLTDRVDWETGEARMRLDRRFVRRDVHAENFVVGNVALQPLDAATHLRERAVGVLGRVLQFMLRHRPDAGHVSFDNEFWHAAFPVNYLYRDRRFRHCQCAVSLPSAGR